LRSGSAFVRLALGGGRGLVGMAEARWGGGYGMMWEKGGVWGLGVI